MKNLLFFFILFSNILIGQENLFKEYSYSQFFKMIEDEQDTIFRLENAIVKFDLDKDLDFKNAFDYDNDTTRVYEIVISKEIRLNNVHFLRDPSGSTQFRGGVISYVHFKKPIYISSTYGVQFDHCIFEKGLEIRNNENKAFDFSQLSDGWFFRSIAVRNSAINDYLGVILDFPFTKPDQFSLLLFNNIIKMGVNKGNGYGPRANGSYLSIKDIPFVNLSNNQFIGKNSVWVSANDVRGVRIINNQFEQVLPFFSMRAQQTQNIDFENNKINKPVVLELTGLKSEFDIDYKQFNQGILNYENWRSFVSYINEKEQQDNDSLMKYPPEDIFDHYNKVYRIQNLSVFKNEVELRGRLINVYREKHDGMFANAIYMDMKDLETDRLAYEYQEEKNFTTYFTWKVNQFLKVFSAYGTEPARAIVMSMYVILFFALIYLFFPNSWDSHGRNRIIDRYKFFFKYLNRNAGIHEVYLEEKQTEMLTYEEFKKTITETEKKVPKFFTWSAYPLYKWAISGTQLTAGILRRMDILQGTWTELPKESKRWKGILLTGAFIIALIYDLIIKMLNALMLSINTFTTLGFGEIPIKGLPRYLAIIQGFIGWFMLTIFSVSLISQLLN